MLQYWAIQLCTKFVNEYSYIDYTYIFSHAWKGSLALWWWHICPSFSRCYIPLQYFITAQYDKQDM
jgi:hypothetical protein